MIGKKKWSLALLAILLAASCSRGIGTYRSSDWQATVHGVSYEKDFGIGAQKMSGLVIEVSLEYIGPGGQGPAPAVTLETGTEPRRRADLVQTNKNDPASDLIIRSWLGDAGTMFTLKKGDKVSKAPLQFLWEMKPEGARGSFKLHVADIPPISIRR